MIDKQDEQLKVEKLKLLQSFETDLIFLRNKIFLSFWKRIFFKEILIQLECDIDKIGYQMYKIYSEDTKKTIQEAEKYYNAVRGKYPLSKYPLISQELAEELKKQDKHQYEFTRKNIETAYGYDPLWYPKRAAPPS